MVPSQRPRRRGFARQVMVAFSPRQRAGSVRVAAVVILTVGVLSAAVYLLRGHGADGPGDRSDTSPNPELTRDDPVDDPRVSGEETTESSATTTDAASDNDRRPVAFETLQGDWRRIDGQYVIEIKQVDADGEMEVAYFNPRPIRIWKSQAVREGDTVRVFIELRDVGYPGCIYRLDYDQQADQLRGVYHQAAMDQQYDVLFVREG